MTVADVVFIWLEKLKAANRQGEIDWKRRKEEEKARRRERARERRMKGQVVIAKDELVEQRPKKWTRETHPKPKPVSKADREEERRKNKKIFNEYKKFGYVYLMRSGNGYYKIGISKNTRNRLDGLKRQYPVQIEVVHQIACHDYRKVEKNLHKMFASKRAEYEWFNLDNKDVKWIMAKKDYQLG